MSFTITTAFVEQFNATVNHLMQQKTARLQDSVRVRSGVTGKSTHFERLDYSEAYNIARHSDTQYANDAHDRITCYLTDWGKALLVDDLDQLKLIINPTSEYSQNIAAALNRKKDQIIYQAIDADATKSNYGLNTAGANGINLALVNDVREFMDSIEAPEGERFFGYTAETISPLFLDANFTSADYNVVKALMQGNMDPNMTWMGFKWRRFNSSHVTKPATNYHSVYAWCKPSVGLAVGRDVTLKVDTLPGKNYATQIYGSMSLGSVMIEKTAIAYMNVASNK